MSETLRVTQLVASRLCHDLVGAAGAVNAGLEILAEMGGLDDAAMELATNSGLEMTRRLSFFRVAFGAGGAGSGQYAEIAVLRRLSQEFFMSGNVEITWPAVEGGVEQIPQTLGKLLLNLILIAADSLPRGGSIAVQVAEIEGGFGVAVSAAGPDAGLREDLAQALTPGLATEKLDSRCIHGLVTQLLVLEAGCELEVAADNDEVRFAALTA